jgi:light-regulated signal transduction histidine kinase (bacteriophytochrome)
MAPTDMIGLRDEDIMEPAAAEACRRTDHAAIESGEVVVSYQTIGDVIYETRKFPVQLAQGGEGVGGYIRDVTAGKRAQEQIERLNAELESRVTLRTEELQLANHELEAFAYSVSHDLRAPLRAIDGFSQIVLEDNTDKLDTATLEHLERIRGSARRMAGLIDDLLQLSRLGRKELSTHDVDVTALVEDVVAELQANEPDRTVEVAVAADMTCKGDPELLRVVFVNLLGNAWKFTSHHETAHIAVASEASAGSRVFSVSDDGAGFDMAYADKLFGAFQRLHSPQDFDGSGIGLATVQRIVARHHGRTWAVGQVDGGATFSFSLPDEPQG